MSDDFSDLRRLISPCTVLDKLSITIKHLMMTNPIQRRLFYFNKHSCNWEAQRYLQWLVKLKTLGPEKNAMMKAATYRMAMAEAMLKTIKEFDNRPSHILRGQYPEFIRGPSTLMTDFGSHFKTQEPLYFGGENPY